jgi:hypothetical protein
VQIQFGLQDSATAYTPDEAGLQVVRLGGHWFALWSDPNQPPTLPTSLRLQIVRVSPRGGVCSWRRTLLDQSLQTTS